jgi:hypothetical protein
MLLTRSPNFSRALEAACSAIGGALLQCVSLNAKSQKRCSLQLSRQSIGLGWISTLALDCRRSISEESAELENETILQLSIPRWIVITSQ